MSSRRIPRVLVLTSTFPRWPDDTEPRFVLDLCRHLSKYADTRVLAPHTQGAETEETLEGVQVRRFRYFPKRYQAIAYDGGILPRLRSNPLRALQLPAFMAAMYQAIRRQVRDWQPDVVHAHWIIPQGLVAALALAGRVPLVCTGHGTDVHGMQGFAFRHLKRWTLERCGAVSVVSASLAEAVTDLAPSVRVAVLPMGTDMSTVFTPPDGGDGRADADIVFAGRLVEGKGVAVLLDAFAALCRRLPGARLIIIGDGPMRARLEMQARRLGPTGSIDFVGALPQRGLADYFRRATMAVVPSLTEGFGLVITEAMGCGCPVIASDIPAVHQSIESGVSGLLVPPGDANALQQAMRSLLDDKVFRDRLALAALAAARRRFDWPVVAENYWRLLEQTIGEPPGTR